MSQSEDSAEEHTQATRQAVVVVDLRDPFKTEAQHCKM